MASTITSLGVASGNDFSSIVEQLVKLKKSQVTRQTTARSNANTIELSGVSTLKSALSSFQSKVTAITDDSQAFKSHKISTTQSSSANVFSLSADSDISNTSFDLAVTQLAKTEKNTRVYSGADGFNNKLEAGTLTFDLGKSDSGKEQTFTVEVKDGDTIETLRKRINKNDYGVTASLVQGKDKDGNSVYSLAISGGKTGDSATQMTVTASPSDTSGTKEGYDSLSLFAIDSSSYATDTSKGWVHQASQDAVVNVDGQEVRSSTNSFENGQIAGLKLTVNQLSEGASDNDTNVVEVNGKKLKTYTVTVSDDSDSSADKMQSFVAAYNTMVTQLANLSKSNTYTDGVSNEDGGDLAGDASVSMIKNQLQNMITRNSSTEDGMTIFDMGIKFNKDGTLSFYSSDFKKAMEKSPNAVNNLLAGDNGVLTKMDKFLDDYTQSSGILDQRTDRLNQVKDDIAAQQERDTQTLEAYETMITKKYSNIDQLMAGYSSSLSNLTSVLSSIKTSSSSSK